MPEQDPKGTPPAQPQGQAPAAPSGTPPPAPPAELELSRHGKITRVPLDKAKDLAQKGLDYEVRTAELKRQEEAMRSNATQFSEYQRLQQQLEQDPAAKRAFLLALRDPQRVISSVERGEAPPPEGEPSAATTQQTTVGPDIANELAQLRGRLESMDSRERARDIETRIKSELAGYPWLKSGDDLNKFGGIAFNQVVAHLQRNPNESIASLAAVCANEVREAQEDVDRGRLKAQSDGDRRRVSDLRAGIPIPALTEKPTKKSFDDGSIKRQAMETFTRVFGS